MKLTDFKIGKTFWMSGKQYRCTDKGTRIVAAICVNPLVKGTKLANCEKITYTKVTNKKEIKSWQNGPPYALAEKVIDEYDMEVCYVRKPKED